LYGGFSGNIFSLDSIYRATEIEGRKYDPIKDYIPNSRHIISIDPGYSSSKFGIMVLQFSRGKCQILFAEDYDNPDITEMVHFIISLTRKFAYCNAIMVDGSALPVVTSLKRMLGEDPNYQEKIKQLKRDHPNRPLLRWMKVLPVNFATEHENMLANAKAMMDDPRNLIQIHPSFTKLIDSLKSATAKEMSLSIALDKQLTVNDDILDCFRIGLSYIQYQPEGA
jgi:hypothetical protein